jgi:hypothetical protein
LPEGHATGELDLVLIGSDCVWCTSHGGVLLPSHIDVNSDSEFYDLWISDSTRSRNRSVYFGYLASMFDFPMSLSMLVLHLTGLCACVLRGHRRPLPSLGLMGLSSDFRPHHTDSCDSLTKIEHISKVIAIILETG